MKCAFQNLPELKVKDSGFLSYPTNSQNQNVFTSNGSKKSTIFLGLTVNQVLNHAVISFLMFVFTPEQVKNHAFISQYMIFLWSCINAVDIMHQKGFGCNCSILLFSENQTEILFNLVRCERFSNPDFDDNFL